MATALAEVVLKQLASLAADQVGLLWGLSGEISKLESTVTSIRAVLMDAEEQSNHNNQVQLWLRQLTEVLYDSEDLLDDISTEALLRNQMDGNRVMNEVGLFFSCSNQVGYALKLAYEIKAIRSKLAYIDQDKNQFKFKTALPVVNMDWRQTHSIVPDVVVGREDDKQKIIDMLRRPSCNEKVEVIPICGMGGLGKTALAQLIFNDDQIKSLFDCKYWVCVSETFELKLVVKSILEAITLQKVEDVALNTLKNNLHALIKGKRLLLVLDDVWNDDKEKWDDFKNLFSSGATEGSRIVVTTRLQIVAEITVTEAVVPHELQGLSKYESWSLFKKVAFKGGEAPSPRIMDIGEEIVEKCKGVPLALRTIGGLLHFKEESEWEAVREKQVLSLVSSRRQDHDNLEAILKLSYDNLPSELKRCFVYCSLFPKDHMFDVKMLVRLWMVQGYCIDINKSSSTRPSHPEDIGIGFFNHLLWRSLFQEVERDAKGNIEFCKMHDLLHDLAIRMAGEDTVMLEASNLTDSFLSCGSINLERIRHLSIDCNGWSGSTLQFSTHLAKAKKLRSFLIINGGRFQREGRRGFRVEEGGRTDIIFSNMTKLKALSLDNKVKIIPATIHNLRHLRYLDISSTHVQTLPEEITRLVNLQVLLLNWCEKLQQLPREIGKLSNLEYLEVVDCWCLDWMPAGFGKLTRLRQLSVFIPEVQFGSGTARLGELMHLNNLSGEFNILGMGRVKDKSEAEAANLKEKLHLRSLYLGWNDGVSNTTSDDQKSVLEAFQPHVNLKEIELVGYGGTSLPASWLSSLVNLVRIEVICCEKLQSLSSLDPLVCLQELKLRKLESLEYVQSRTMTTMQSSPFTSSQVLPSLMSLQIKECPNLIGWSTTKAELPLLPCVSKLSIEDCPKMESIPHFLVQFEKVVLRNVSSELLSEFSESLSAPPPSVNPRFQYLIFQEMKCLKVLPQVLLPHLTFLERLFIFRCHNLTTLSPLQHLPSLLRLDIYECGALDLEDYNHAGDDENNNFPPLQCTLPSLRSLSIQGVPKLATLPEWLQHSSGLQDLEIEECDNLKCLPSWLTKLTALKSLDLQKCSLLSGRCSSTAAEDWRNIAHIANISIDYTKIQEHGRYLAAEEEAEAELEEEEDETEEAEVVEEEDETEESDAEEVEEDESEAAAAPSLNNQLSRMLGNCIGWVTCNLFQRCFLSE